MEPTPAKHIFMSYSQPKRIMRTLIVLALLMVALYFYIGLMTFVLWVLSAGIVIALVQAVKQMFARGPLVIITDEGPILFVVLTFIVLSRA